jgi:hypothetical protein
VCRLLIDRLDRPNRLVAGNKRKPAGELATVLLMVDPAQPAGSDPHRLVGADLRHPRLPNEA